MIIKSIELKNFRNYEQLQIDFDKATNILFGDNAQGKTNILESIYFLSNLKYTTVNPIKITNIITPTASERSV